ncbi:hypothetical protein [Streptomyces sp. NPDC006925]|uniref:hypothetical protein n=1 Tax=Streptomyces sp. NPDC006925 TaxID=3364768 RepID=UPI0036B698CE
MIYATLESIRCHTETDEVGADEPYVIVAAVDLSASLPVAGFPLPIPASRAYRYGPFEDVDAKETHGAPFISFWGLNGEERALSNPDDAIFMVGLMENDNGSAEALRGLVAAQVNSALFSSLNADRTTRVNLIRQAFISAMETPTGAPNFDDRVGDPQELRFTREDIALAETGNPARRSLRFSGDGGNYTTTFQARNRGQAAWRFCFRCHSMFFDGFPSKGVCSAGGGHAAAGWMFYLPHEHAGPDGGQPDWRFCNRCFAMYWSGDRANQGVCPVGGVHNAQGYNFFLPHDHGGGGQDQWRFCGKCRLMFWNGEPNKGVCPTGGGHDAQGFNFKLDFTP